MSLWVTALATALILGAVLVPVAALAGRGRRRLRGLSQVALPPASGEGALPVDPALEGLLGTTRAWVQSLEGAKRLAPDYREVLPMLEVMASARSSPGVYPANFVGDLKDAFETSIADAHDVAASWAQEWAKVPDSLRAGLRDGFDAEVVRALNASHRREPTLDRRQASAFAWATGPHVDRAMREAGEILEALRRLEQGIHALGPDPYR